STVTIDARNKLTTTVLDALGNVLQTQDQDGNGYQYQYDALNRKTVTIDQLGNRATMTYDLLGHMTSKKDPNGNTTFGVCDALGRQTEVVSPDPYKAASLAAGLNASSSQYLTAASTGSLQTGDLDFWLAGWFYPTGDATTKGLVTKADGNAF